MRLSTFDNLCPRHFSRSGLSGPTVCVRACTRAHVHTYNTSDYEADVVSDDNRLSYSSLQLSQSEIVISIPATQSCFLIECKGFLDLSKLTQILENIFQENCTKTLVCKWWLTSEINCREPNKIQ
jgi:hypothetical protein